MIWKADRWTEQKFPEFCELRSLTVQLNININIDMRTSEENCGHLAGKLVFKSIFRE